MVASTEVVSPIVEDIQFIEKVFEKNEEVLDLDRSSLQASPLTLTDFSGNELGVNTEKPHIIDNELFSGHVLLKMKAGDMAEEYEKYFEGKKRTFELQVQGKFKDITDNDRVFLGVETPMPLNLGFWARMILTIVKAFVHQIEPSSVVSLGDISTNEVGAITFPLQESCDKLIITPPGEEPPELCKATMLPGGLSKAEMKKVVDYNNDDTYTLSMHGMYVNWLQWRLVNIPGVPNVHIENFCEDMPVSFVAYTLPKTYNGPHMQADKRYLFQVKMSPASRSIIDASDDSQTMSQTTTSTGSENSL
eukprot:CFRG1056T1